MGGSQGNHRGFKLLAAILAGVSPASNQNHKKPSSTAVHQNAVGAEQPQVLRPDAVRPESAWTQETGYSAAFTSISRTTSSRIKLSAMPA